MTQKEISALSNDELQKLSRERGKAGSLKGMYTKNALYAQKELNARINFLALDWEEEYFSREFKKEYKNEYIY